MVVGGSAVLEAPTTVRWPDAVDDIMGGDLVAVVGSPTPQGGVALCCVAPIGIRDRDAGTVGFTCPLGFGKKLERIAADPRIAIAYHTRRHGLSDQPGYALVQGTAHYTPIASKRWFVEQMAKYDEGLVPGRLWDEWLEVYYSDRVIVTVDVRRILWWPGGVGAGAPEVFGAPLPDEDPPSQPPPKDADRARVRVGGVVLAARRGHRLLGVLLADGSPQILPVEVTAAGPDALELSANRLLPSGERRAGVIAHDFRAGLAGMWMATHTGWLRTSPTLRWTPHTRHVFYAPPSRLAVVIGSGLATRWRAAVRRHEDVRGGHHMSARPRRELSRP